MIINGLLEGLRLTFFLAVIMAVVITAVFLTYGWARRRFQERRLRGPMSDLLDRLIARLREKPAYASVVIADDETRHGRARLRILIIETGAEDGYNLSVDLMTGKIWAAVPDRRVVFPIDLWVRSPWLVSRFREIDRLLGELPR